MRRSILHLGTPGTWWETHSTSGILEAVRKRDEGARDVLVLTHPRVGHFHFWRALGIPHSWTPNAGVQGKLRKRFIFLVSMGEVRWGQVPLLNSPTGRRKR